MKVQNPGEKYPSKPKAFQHWVKAFCQAFLTSVFKFVFVDEQKCEVIFNYFGREVCRSFKRIEEVWKINKKKQPAVGLQRLTADCFYGT